MLNNISQEQNTPRQLERLAAPRYPYPGNTPTIKHFFHCTLVCCVNLTNLAPIAFYMI